MLWRGAVWFALLRSAPLLLVIFIFAVTVALFNRGFRELRFPKTVGDFWIEVRKHEVEDVRVPVYGVALDAVLDVLCVEKLANKIK